MPNYSVWVGGSEVNDYALPLEKAQQWADQYKQDGYEDVAIEEIEGNWETYKFAQWERN